MTGSQYVLQGELQGGLILKILGESCSRGSLRRRLEVDSWCHFTREDARLHPRDQEALFALVSFHRDAGEIASALEYAIRLQNLAPEDPRWRQLVPALESGR